MPNHGIRPVAFLWAVERHRPVRALLLNEDPFVRNRAVAALTGPLKWTPSSLEDEATLAIVREDWRKCVEIGPAAVPVLIEVVRRDNLRHDAIEGLAKLKDPRAADVLILALEGQHPGGFSDPFARKYAAEGLGELRAERAIPALTVAAEKDDQDFVRAAAFEALAKMPAPKVAVAAPAVEANSATTLMPVVVPTPAASGEEERGTATSRSVLATLVTAGAVIVSLAWYYALRR